LFFPIKNLKIQFVGPKIINLRRYSFLAIISKLDKKAAGKSLTLSEDKIAK